MHAGRPEQVLAAHHLGDALQGIVDHDRKMIAGRRLLARQDDIAPSFRPGGDRAGFAVRDLRPARSSSRSPTRAQAAAMSSRSA